MKHIRNLDGLRGYALLGVLLYHLLLRAPFGWMGIELFFVLSGFLITRILSETRHLSFGACLKRFYLRRLLRILPFLVLFLIGMAAYLVWAGEARVLGSDYPFLLTFTYNWGQQMDGRGWFWFAHLWSLSVEEQFYLFWPFIVYFCPPRWMLRVALAFVALCPLARFAMADHYLEVAGGDWRLAGDFLYHNTLTQMDAFAVGAIVAIGPQLAKRPWHHHFVLAVAAVVFLVSGLGLTLWLANSEFERLVAWLTLGFPFPLWGHYQYCWGYSVLAIMFGALIYWGANTRPVWLLSNWLIVDLGKVSYGMYILHLALIRFYNWFLSWHRPGLNWYDDWFWLPSYFVVLYGICKLVYHLVEVPCLRLKSRIS